jgi:hypothetical protein
MRIFLKPPIGDQGNQLYFEMLFIITGAVLISFGWLVVSFYGNLRLQDLEHLGKEIPKFIVLGHGNDGAGDDEASFDRKTTCDKR